MAEKANDFAATVAGGTFHGDFHRLLHVHAIYWAWRKEEPSRHYYVHVAPLTGIDARAEDVTDFLKRRFERLFPLGAVGKDDRIVQQATAFTIATRTPFPSEVVCIAATPYQFTFQTVPNRHALKGEITFGVFKDAVGVLWLFQQGQGYSGENAFQLLLTRIMPRFLWYRMRRNLLVLWKKERGA